MQTELLNEDFEGIMRILKSVQDMVHEEEKLVTYIYDVSFPKWVYDEIPQLESEFQKEIWYYKDNNKRRIWIALSFIYE